MLPQAQPDIIHVDNLIRIVVSVLGVMVSGGIMSLFRMWKKQDVQDKVIEGLAATTEKLDESTDNLRNANEALRQTVGVVDEQLRNIAATAARHESNHGEHFDHQKDQEIHQKAMSVDLVESKFEIVKGRLKNLEQNKG